MSAPPQYTRVPLDDSEDMDDDERQPLTSNDEVTSTAVAEETESRENLPEATDAPPEDVAVEGAAGATAENSAEPPPAYTVAVKLPSYEEAERTKGSDVGHQAGAGHGIGLVMGHGDHRDGGTSFFVPFSPFANPDFDMSPLTDQCSDAVLGTNIDYLCTFMVAFLFNWIGFLAASCFTNTVAGRFGALAGFGLSLVKWTLIFKHSTDFVTQDWLWWILIMLGFFMFFRGSVQYMRVKQTWARLTPEARNRLLYYYY